MRSPTLSSSSSISGTPSLSASAGSAVCSRAACRVLVGCPGGTWCQPLSGPVDFQTSRTRAKSRSEQGPNGPIVPCRPSPYFVGHDSLGGGIHECRGVRLLLHVSEAQQQGCPLTSLGAKVSRFGTIPHRMKLSGAARRGWLFHALIVRLSVLRSHAGKTAKETRHAD